MEVDGERLSSKGWHKANAFFLVPVPPPKDKQITVIYKNIQFGIQS